MKDDFKWPATLLRVSAAKPKAKIWIGSSVIALAIAGAVALYSNSSPTTANPGPVAGPTVTVSQPLQQEISPRLGFLGQFSAVKHVELRAQVGGTLNEIRFKDGDIVRKGDVLFVIDPIPYEIKLSQATAQLETANARLELAKRELDRAETLKREDAGSAQNVDQRAAEHRAAIAAVEAGKASVRDAHFDLDRTRITAPFTGRISTHLVSVGNLVSGSRAGSGPTTLLTTLVSLDPIYVNFDMSEADYSTFQRERSKQSGPLAEKVEITLGESNDYDRTGTLNFVDNALNRSSGTIHARATLSNADSMLTPGAFARVRLSVAKATPTLLVPDASVLSDRTNRVVLTVDAENKIQPKSVQLGELRDGLRVIRSGLEATDRVVIDGIPIAAPGSTVTPKEGKIQPKVPIGKGGDKS